MKFFKITLLFILMLIPVFVSISVQSLSEPTCSDYEFIFARGSGQSLDASDFNAFKSEITKRFKRENISFYEVGSSQNGYPAVALNFSTALGAYISAGKSYRYGDSINRGSKELILHINSASKQCKNKKFILAGYSQGAHVIDRSLNFINSDKVVYVASFGDPKLYLPEGKRACQHVGLSPYRVYAPDCKIKEGILGGMKPYQPAGYYNKMGIWCNQDDLICGSALNIFNPLKTHVAYIEKGSYQKFAEIVSKKIANIKIKSARHADKKDIVNTKTPNKDNTTITKPNPIEKDGVVNTKTDPTDAKYSEHKPMDVAIILDFSNVFLLPAGQNRMFSDAVRDKIIKLLHQGVRVSLYMSYSLYRIQEPTQVMVPFDYDHIIEEDLDNMLFSIVSDKPYLHVNENNLYESIAYVARNEDWFKGYEHNIYVYSNYHHTSQLGRYGTTREEALKIAKEHNIKLTAISDLPSPQDDFSDTKNISTFNNTSLGDFSTIKNNFHPAKSTGLIKMSKTAVYNPKNYFSKTIKINQSSPYTLIVVNDLVYGISKNKTITITDLDRRADNEIRLVGYDETGHASNAKTISYPSEKITPPETGIPKL